jgi:hypothetical protein
MHSRAGADASMENETVVVLIAEEDRMINPKTLHFMADRMKAKVQSHPVDHSPMYTEPNLVIDVILDAARETLSR